MPPSFGSRRWRLQEAGAPREPPTDGGAPGASIKDLAGSMGREELLDCNVGGLLSEVSFVCLFNSCFLSYIGLGRRVYYRDDAQRHQST